MCAATPGTTTTGAQLGNQGWSYEDVLPFFRKAENNERGADKFHGTGGPLNVADIGARIASSKLSSRARNSSAFRKIRISTARRRKGPGITNSTRAAGFVAAPRSAYLRPIKRHPKLSVKNRRACNLHSFQRQASERRRLCLAGPRAGGEGEARGHS